jgi:hypothetical protein
MSNKQWLSTKEMAAQTPYNEQTLRRLINMGAFKHGYHYVDKRTPGSQRPCYSFNVLRVKEWLSQPPEVRDNA